jgi:hypothetical protein
MSLTFTPPVCSRTGGTDFGSPRFSYFRLSEMTDWKVLLLEAGGEEPDAADIPAFQPLTTQSHLNWFYESVPDSRFCGGKSCAFMTGKGLGGSSLHNEMLYSRGNRRIFDIWKEMGMFSFFIALIHHIFLSYSSPIYSVSLSCPHSLHPPLYLSSFPLCFVVLSHFILLLFHFLFLLISDLHLHHLHISLPPYSYFSFSFPTS